MHMRDYENMLLCYLWRCPKTRHKLETKLGACVVLHVSLIDNSWITQKVFAMFIYMRLVNRASNDLIVLIMENV